MGLRNLITIIICFVGFSISAQTETRQKSNTKPLKVKNNIYIIQSKGGNIGLSSGNDGVFMIDDQFENAIPGIITEIKKLNDKPIKYLVNTHHHGDHTGGNILIAKNGTIIFSHENVRKRLGDYIRNSSVKIDADILPIITFSEDLTFHFNGEKIMVFHVHNAHTDGDVIVYFTKSNVIHTGDIFFNGKYPFIDLNSGGSLQGSIDAIDKILMLADDKTIIIPGHGNLASINDLRTTRSMLTFLWKRIRHHIVNKKTEDEVVNMKELTEEYDAKGFGDGFISTDKFIRTIYKDVIKDLGPIDNRTMEERLNDKLKDAENKNKG